MYRKTLPTLIVLLLGISPYDSKADLIFKRKVIDRCDEAKADLLILERDKQIASIEDLKLILKLDLTTFDNSNPDLNLSPHKIPAMNAPMEGVKGEEFWKTFQPDREVKAKFCALEILKSLSPYSIDALPEMIELTQNHTLPHKLQNLLYDLIQNVLLDAKNDEKFSIPLQVIDRLILMLDKPYSYYAQSALIELHKLSLPKLLKKMEDPDVRYRQLIVDTLLRLDSEGNIIGSDVLSLLQTSDDGLRKRAINLLSELDSFYSFSLPPIIDLLFDISPDIQNSSVEALDKIFSNLKEVPKISLGEASINILFKKLLLSQGNDRKVMAKGLSKLANMNDAFEKKIIDSFKTEDVELKADLLSLTGPQHGKVSPQIKSLLFNAFKDKSNLVRIKSIQVINRAKLNNPVSNAALLKLLDEPDVNIRMQADTEIISLGKAIAPELLKYFKAKSAADKARLIRLMVQVIPADKEVAVHFENTIKKQTCDGKAALIVLAPKLGSKIRQALIKDLISCLHNPETDLSLITDALTSLSPLNSEEKASLRKALDSAGLPDKALLFLLVNSSKLDLNNDELTIIFRRLLTIEDKAIKFRTISYLNSLENAKELPLLEDLLKFQRENSDDDLLGNEAVVAISKIDNSGFDAVEFFTKEIGSDRYQWAEKYIGRIDSNVALDIISRSLNSLPVSKKSIAINMAGNFGEAAKSMLPKIKEYLEAPDINLSYSATVALVKIDPSDPQAAESLKKILFRDLSEALLKENFNKSMKPLLGNLKLTSVSFLERKLISSLEERIG